MQFVIPNSILSESNDCHNPSGSGGGQFCSKTGDKPLTAWEAHHRSERVADLVKWDKLADGYIKNVGGYQIYGHKNGTYTVRLTRDLGEIGRANVVDRHGDGPDGWLKSLGPGDYLTSVSVDKEFQRHGIATKLYNAIEKHLGKKLRPSPTYQSADARAFWAKRVKA